MNEKLENILNIRYIKLHFTTVMTEDCRLPKYKTSAIRGGMGQMLLRNNCIKDGKCENCSFFNDCLVQRTMYSRLTNVPEFMSAKDSVGYVIECDNNREYFYEGEELKFNLLLFGSNICYFNLYMQALYLLSQAGLGKYEAKFQIVSVTNSRNEPVLDSYGNVHMRNYRVEYVRDYVSYRMRSLSRNGWNGKIRFHSPLAVKYQGELLKEFRMEAILSSCARRVYVLGSLEQLNVEQYYIDYGKIPEIMLSENTREVTIPRYSTRQESKMFLRGITGTIRIEEVSEEYLVLLLAGELIHIGKYSSFGFGRYRLV